MQKQPVKSQTSLHVDTVWSKPLLFAVFLTVGIIGLCKHKRELDMDSQTECSLFAFALGAFFHDMAYLEF